MYRLIIRFILIISLGFSGACSLQSSEPNEVEYQPQLSKNTSESSPEQWNKPKILFHTHQPRIVRDSSLYLKYYDANHLANFLLLTSFKEAVYYLGLQGIDVYVLDQPEECASCEMPQSLRDFYFQNTPQDDDFSVNGFWLPPGFKNKHLDIEISRHTILLPNEDYVKLYHEYFHYLLATSVQEPQSSEEKETEWMNYNEFKIQIEKSIEEIELNVFELSLVYENEVSSLSEPGYFEYEEVMYERNFKALTQMTPLYEKLQENGARISRRTWSYFIEEIFVSLKVFELKTTDTRFRKNNDQVFYDYLTKVLQPLEKIQKIHSNAIELIRKVNITNDRSLFKEENAYIYKHNAFVETLKVLQQNLRESQPEVANETEFEE